MSLLKSFALKWDLMAGRYEAFFATTKEEIDGCIKVLEEVRQKELNRVSGNSVIQSSAFLNNETGATFSMTHTIASGCSYPNTFTRIPN